MGFIDTLLNIFGWYIAIASAPIVIGIIGSLFWEKIQPTKRQFLVFVTGITGFVCLLMIMGTLKNANQKRMADAYYSSLCNAPAVPKVPPTVP